MHIERIWTDNRYRNYNYLIGCPDSGQCVAVDPLDWRSCLDRAAARGWRVSLIVNTHEHGDHVGGNPALVKHTGARVLAHPEASVPEQSGTLSHGEVLELGKVRLKVLDTPGHTMSHICLYGEDDEGPLLLSGDTLFNAGAGNCHNGGYPQALFRTFEEQLFTLPPDTRIYPGHDYLENNLGFTLDREPGNAAAAALLEAIAGEPPEARRVLRLSDEAQINTFFRLEEAEIIAGLGLSQPTREDVFLALRAARNRW